MARAIAAPATCTPVMNAVFRTYQLGGQRHVRSKSAIGIPGRPPSAFTAQRRLSLICRRISALVALSAQMLFPRERNSHEAITDGRGQFWTFPSQLFQPRGEHC